MKVTIHQPEHLIWLGLLDKIKQADIYVVLDTVQFRKNYFQNRNRILTPNGSVWITVPVKKHPFRTLIKGIEISYLQDWIPKYLGKIEVSYRKAKFFFQYYPAIKSIILEKQKRLANLNVKLIKLLLKNFGIKTKLILASELGLGSNLSICRMLKADTYLSGPFGENYLDQESFEDAGIEIEFHKFEHPKICISSIDRLFNRGTMNE